MKVFGIAGYSGAGKTTLIERLLQHFVARGLRVSVIKQSHHDVQLEPPDKDSARHRQGGAFEVILTSPYRWMLAAEVVEEPGLHTHLQRLAECDLVLVEGFRHADLPKLEVNRAVTKQPWLHPDDARVLAVASDIPVQGSPFFDLNDIPAIAGFILEHAEYVER
jgi:molybdopterin-guanine dinucleotide biosynthesis protein B